MLFAPSCCRCVFLRPSAVSSLRLLFDHSASSLRQCHKPAFALADVDTEKIGSSDELPTLEPKTDWERSLTNVQLEKLCVIRAEHKTVQSALSKYTPVELTEEELKALMSFNYRRGRIKYIMRIAKHQNDIARKLEQRNAAQADSAKNSPQSPLDVGQSEPRPKPSTFILPLNQANATRQLQSRLLPAIRTGGPKLVFDLSFLPDFNVVEQQEPIIHLRHCHSVNRGHKQPFQLYFTGISRSASHFRYIEDNFPQLEQHADYLVTMTDRSYLDLFAKDRLVYLSPYGKEDLMEFDSDKVYILGSMVDRMNRVNTAARAEEQGIASARLPLDKFVDWKSGGRCLCVNQVLGMLLDVHLHGSWPLAIRNHLPQRKLVGNELSPLAKERWLRKRKLVNEMLLLCKKDIPGTYDFV